MRMLVVLGPTDQWHAGHIPLDKNVSLRKSIGNAYAIFRLPPDDVRTLDLWQPLGARSILKTNGERISNETFRLRRKRVSYALALEFGRENKK
jgi:hypothetical protein